MKFLQTLTLVFAVMSCGLAAAPQPKGSFVQPDNLFPTIKMTTNFGELTIELDRVRAPITVDNFLSYVVAGRYDNTIFHRLEPNFVLQGGGYTVDMESVDEFEPIANESGNGLKNEQYTIAMARLYSPHSAKSQFFFNLADNKSLDPGRNWGYAVFGAVTFGEEILEKIKQIPTGTSEELGWPSFPEEKIVILKVEILEQ